MRRRVQVLLWSAPMWFGNPTDLLGQGLSLGPALEVVREFRLEETDESLVAAPRMIQDPRGGWLYWDFQARDVRLFAADGSLRNAFGGPGEGPGEFSSRLVGVVRLEDGRLVVVDGGGRVSLWTELGDSLLDDFNSGVTRPYGVVSVGGGQVVILSAPVITDPDSLDVPVLHLVSLGQRGIERSFFVPPLTPSTLTAALQVESPPPVFHEGRVHVAMSPFRRLWSVAPGSNSEVASVQIESEALAASPEGVSASAGRAAFRSWVNAASFPGRFFAMPEGGWVMQTWGLRTEGPVRGIVRIRADGSRLWEAQDTPELLSVDSATGFIYLWDPEGLDPGLVHVVRETGRGL